MPNRKPATPRRWASLTEAAEYLNTTPRTVRRRIAEGTITGYRLGRRMIRVVDLDEIDAAMKPMLKPPTQKG